MQQPFQSTLPTRGSDLSMGLGRVRNAHFNPRSPRGGATDTLYKVLAANAISIHAPHEGERRDSREFYILSLRFQSTLPTRGSDMSIFLQQRLWQISIHAPHEGERLDSIGTCWEVDKISIHAPHEGERHAHAPAEARGGRISIHAPHEGERL